MAVSGVAIRGQRSLLRQIREALAGGGPAQTRLDMVVRIIARSMVAEVCSLYMRRAAGDMELFATEGLDPAAVHVTRMKPGEGLVGEIMRQGRPLNLADAPEHPAFSYRPETGEDPFHAFLGVPLLRGGRAIGVLVVQNRTSRVYAEDEVEDLQIIAMGLVEMVAAGNLLGAEELKDVEIAPHRAERLKGAKFADGLAMGAVVLHEPPVAAGRLLADDPVAEEERLASAIVDLQEQIDAMLDGHQGILKGLLLEEGSSASHAAIVARALDIPCVGRLAGLRDRVSEGDPVIVDAETGEAYLRPRPDVVSAIRTRMEVRAQRRAEFERLRETP